MKKLITLMACGAFTALYAQTILYSENFEGVSTFTLNTADYFSTTTGYNAWYINNSFSGGTYNDFVCGFGSVPIAGTPVQPAGITGFPTSNYLHISDVDAYGQGVTNCNFAASDGGLVCLDDENYFSRMTSDISTVGNVGVSLSFYWICAGSAESYGEVYYSVNGGTTWLLVQGNMQGQNSWTQFSMANAAWDNQATLRFGWRFANNQTLSASDPAFGVDEISIFVPTSTITPGIINPTAACAGSNVMVPYTISGTFTAGNIFTAELSDNTGSFAAPTSIGTLNSTTAGTISATIPLASPAGANYLIRVTSSTPAITGSNSALETIVDCSGVEDENLFQVSLYPNPSADYFTISLNENIMADTKISILNMVGQTVANLIPNQSKTMLSTESLGMKAGIYLVQIKYNDKTKVLRLIVK